MAPDARWVGHDNASRPRVGLRPIPYRESGASLPPLLLLVYLAAGRCFRVSPPSAVRRSCDRRRAIREVVLAWAPTSDYWTPTRTGRWKEEAQPTRCRSVRSARVPTREAGLDARPPAAGDTIGSRDPLPRRQLESLVGRVRMLQGEKMSFDEESRVLYDVVVPSRDDEAFAPVLARLDSLLPGRGPLHERYESFRKGLIIPPARVDTVFRAAIEEARRRTRAHLALPDTESFTVEYVKDQRGRLQLDGVAEDLSGQSGPADPYRPAPRLAAMRATPTSCVQALLEKRGEGARLLESACSLFSPIR